MSGGRIHRNHVGSYNVARFIQREHVTTFPEFGHIYPDVQIVYPDVQIVRDELTSYSA